MDTTPIIARKTTRILLALAVFIVLSLPLIALGDDSMMADSPVNSYTAGVMLYMLLVGFLVTLLLGGAFAVISLGLMSKRAEDKALGNRDPSDAAILKQSRNFHILPAEEGEIEDPFTRLETRQASAAEATLVTEEQMFNHHQRAA